jgi:hypothetical protein
MKKITLIVFLFIFTYTSYAQDSTFHRKYELMGSMSYNFSITLSQLAGEGSISTFRTHSILVSTSTGYFLNPKIELLFDLNYTFYYTYNGAYFLTQREWDHRFGFKAGAAYNWNINKNVELFTGAKIGISWTRSSYDNSSRKDYASTWRKPEIAFPVLLFGSRFLITKNCSFTPLIEYEYIGNKENIYFWTRSNHNISLNFGISVIF